MIKYRYHLLTDPEPGPHVKRLRSWRPGLGGGKFAETWIRVPCHSHGSGTIRIMIAMTRQERRWARRNGHFYVTKSGRRMHRPRSSHLYRIRHDHCEYEHYHWYNGDKYRAWGPLRGDTLAVDADAMRRLHTRTKKRRGWR
jgi:predicted amidohydrolase